MIFRQLFDPTSSTYTYLLGCEETRDAVVIDPVFEQHKRDAALLHELGLTIRYVLDTHVHADHVTSAWLMKVNQHAQIVLSARYGIAEVDIDVDQGDVLGFGNCALRVLATPGHTSGCVTYVTHDNSMAFTGDCLMIRGTGRTDFQGGDVSAMWHSIQEQIFSLPDTSLIYPGHDYYGRTVSTVGEEKRFNPRIGGDARLEDFAGYMENLGLPHPRLLDIAVPANQHCGKPDREMHDDHIDWAPIVITFAGVPEIHPDWVARHFDEVLILDVRSAAEFDGDLGHLENALLIPLAELRERQDEIPKDKPVVTVCQSGKRSAMATTILLQADFPQVANLPGGMLQWSRLALPRRQVKD